MRGQFCTLGTQAMSAASVVVTHGWGVLLHLACGGQGRCSASYRARGAPQQRTTQPNVTVPKLGSCSRLLLNRKTVFFKNAETLDYSILNQSTRPDVAHSTSLPFSLLNRSLLKAEQTGELSHTLPRKRRWSPSQAYPGKSGPQVVAFLGGLSSRE